jgi:predicted secreted acid phosphatase
MDVDETILDNSPYQVSLDKTGASYIPKTWGNWVKQASAGLVEPKQISVLLTAKL